MEGMLVNYSLQYFNLNSSVERNNLKGQGTGYYVRAPLGFEWS